MLLRLTAIYLVLTLLGSSMATADEPLIQRFRREAPEGWKSLRESTLHRQGTLTVLGEAIEGFDKSLNGSTKVVFAFDAPQMMLHFVQEASRPGLPRRDYLYGINGEYSFFLEKPKRDEPWTVGSMDRNGERLNKKVRSFGSQLFASYMIDEQDLTSIVAKPGFRIESIRSVADQGPDLVELKFTAKEFENKRYQIKAGTIRFNPLKYWCVVGYDLDLLLDAPAKSAARQKYDDIDGYPAIKEIVYDFTSIAPDKQLFHRRKTSTIDYEPEAPSSKIFRLAAYGMPEPSSPGTAGRSWWLIYSYLGLLCFSGAYALRRLRARSGAIPQTQVSHG